MVCAKGTIGSGITWAKQMVLLGDKVQVEAHFGPLRNNANFDARLVHDLCRTCHRLENQLARTRWNS
jgi:hypothetical protein